MIVVQFTATAMLIRGSIIEKTAKLTRKFRKDYNLLFIK